MAQSQPDPDADAEQSSRVEILGADDISRSLSRIAYEIIERNRGAGDIVLAGIPTRGATLARRLAARIEDVTGTAPALAIIDTTMYRDDLDRQPMRAPHLTEIPTYGIGGRVVVLVDDVLYTGRTVKAALDALTDIGRPAAVQLAVLVDRGHRELPIRADYVGKNLPTSRTESVSIQLEETDGADAIILTRGGGT